MEKYNLLSPKVDIIFKALFVGEDIESKTILLSFLNAILNPKRKIVDIIELNPYDEREYIDDKLSIMDIRVKTDNDEIVDIQIQVGSNVNYRKRALYYWSKLYGETINSGKNYLELKKCIVISILDFNLITENDKYHNIFKVKEIENNFELLDDFEMHYLELRKFEEDKDTYTDLERWLTFIKSSDNEELIDKIKDESEVLSIAVNKLIELSENDFIREEYYARENLLVSEISKINYAENRYNEGIEIGIQKGIEKGIERGKEQGIYFEKLNTARNLLMLGADINLIRKATDLTDEEIDNVKDNI